MSTANQVINFNVTKASSGVFIFAVISFFMHLLLHNYNISQENIKENKKHTSNHIISFDDNILKEKELIENIQITSVQEPVTHVTKDSETKKTNKLNVKKIGNVSLFTLQKGNTFSELLFEIGLTKNKSHIISDAVNKKYNLSKLKIGTVIQIIDSSTKNVDNIKVIISQKDEIMIKGKNSRYSILIKNLGVLQKVNTVNTIQEPKPIQKLKLVEKSIHTAAINKKTKRDLIAIVQLLKQENNLKDNITNLELVYEKTGKDEKVFYVDVQTPASKIRVYKYKDRTGVVRYIKNNGMILTKNKSVVQKHPISVFNLSYPIRNPVVGSGFGLRLHPIIHQVRMHKGIDFRASKGTPIHAPADGIIIGMTTNRGFGKHIKIRHNGVYSTLYAHLDRFANDKTVGGRVKKGEIIGYVGHSGLASGDHLHFELHESGRPVNPLRLISNTSNNVKTNSIEVQYLNAKQMNAFKAYQLHIDKQIKSL